MVKLYVTLASWTCTGSTRLNAQCCWSSVSGMYAFLLSGSKSWCLELHPCYSRFKQGYLFSQLTRWITALQLVPYYSFTKGIFSSSKYGFPSSKNRLHLYCSDTSSQCVWTPASLKESDSLRLHLTLLFLRCVITTWEASPWYFKSLLFTTEEGKLPSPKQISFCCEDKGPGRQGRARCLLILQLLALISLWKQKWNGEIENLIGVK